MYASIHPGPRTSVRMDDFGICEYATGREPHVVITINEGSASSQLDIHISSAAFARTLRDLFAAATAAIEIHEADLAILEAVTS